MGPNLIQESLDRWRQTEKPQKAPAPTEQLSPEVARWLLDLFGRERAAARADLEGEVAVLKDEKAELLAACAKRDEEAASLIEQVERLTRERNTVAGQLTEVTTERDRQMLDLERERKAAEDLRVKLAEKNLAVEQQNKQSDTLRVKQEALRAELQVERQSRIAAEREQAGLKAKSEGLADRVKDLQTREHEAVQAADGLREELAHLQEKYASTAREAGAATGARERADAQIQELRGTLKECQSAREHLARDNERLTEQARRHTLT